jgi:3-deoxy-D-manno-octulosonate 8-phosphate phosphatase (KDO 8-P phosphatase)
MKILNLGNISEYLASVKLIVFDFDGVFTDNTVYVSQNGLESIRCWRSDGLGLSRLAEAGVKTYILSTESNPVVGMRADKLKISYRQCVEDKAVAIIDICRELGISPQQTIFVGNDINDIPAFKAVGIAVGVADSYNEINPYILFKTERGGGRGAVREICDIVINAKMNSSK